MTEGNSLFDRIYADRREEAKQERADRELENWNFRMQQAEKAKKLVTLSRGSIALKVATLVIDAFPNAEPTFRNGERVSRTQAAKIEMLDQLSEAELDEKHRKSVELGVKRASRALREAFDQMKNLSPEEPSSALVDSESESATD